MRRPSRIGSSVVKYVGLSDMAVQAARARDTVKAGRVEGKAGFDGGMRLAKTAEMSEGPQLKMRVRDIHSSQAGALPRRRPSSRRERAPRPTGLPKIF